MEYFGSYGYFFFFSGALFLYHCVSQKLNVGEYCFVFCGYFFFFSGALFQYCCSTPAKFVKVYYILLLVISNNLTIVINVSDIKNHRKTGLMVVSSNDT